jgi:hypothetical protein
MLTTRRAIVAAAALILICVCIAIASPSKPKATPTATPAPIATIAQAQATNPSAPIATTAPAQPTATNAPIATATRAPTNTARPLPTATPAPVTTGKVGDMIESGGIAVGIASVQKVAKVSIWTPKAGNTYLVIEAVIQNVSRDTAPYNPLYFKVKDADGFEYTTSFGGADPALRSGELAKGEKVRGMVTFEVLETSKGFVVSYEPMVIFGGYKAIKIDLGQ